MQENNPNNEIIDLIIRSLRKELDVEEEKILQDWLEEKTVHREEYNQYVRNYFHFRWAEEEQAIHQEQAWNKIFSTLERKKRMGWYYGVAASMVLLVTLAVTLLLKNDNVSVEPQLAYSFIPQHTQPHLILADGEVIRLDSVKKAVTTKDGSVVYGKNGTGIYYDSLPAKNNRERMWHTVVVPRGGEYYICLSDGSEVWLNSETKISYPVYFTGDLREISLSGDAYFKVAKENTRPFCVRSGEYCLKVYGTEFNLNTYDEENFEAVLVKGSVGFQANEAAPEKRLKVNQLGVANSKAGTSVIQDVDVTSYIAWKSFILWRI